MTNSTVISELQSVIIQEAVDEVYINLPREKYGHLIEAIVHLCEEQGIIVRVWTDMFGLRIAKPQIDELDGIPVVTIRSGPPDGWQIIAKRMIDILGSIVLLVLLAPLFIVIAGLVKMDSRGPVFFRQERVGFNKRHFWILKFRTMVTEAEQQQQALERFNEVNGAAFKIKNDPRITRIGRFLRRFSLDELPQLVNVLVGEMSLVGPRPLPVRDVQHIDIQWHRRRFSIKPGLTCLWQVNGRSTVDFENWVRMDLDYIDKWSLGLDVRILLKTIPAVLKGSGAY